MLGAYSPWMRTAAMVHVILAACYGFVFWDLSWFPWLARQINHCVRSPEWHECIYFKSSTMTFFVCGLFLLPVLYLWAIRYCTMCCYSTEISALLKDISTLSEATCFLHHLLCQSLPAKHATKTALTSRNHPDRESASDAAGSMAAAVIPSAPYEARFDQSDLQGSPPESMQNMLEVRSSKSGQSQSSQAELIKPAEKVPGHHAAEQSQGGSSSNTEVLPETAQVCKRQSASTGSFSPAPPEQSECGIRKDEHVASQPATPVDDNRHALPAALKPRAEAALEASRTMSANLYARLEAYVHVRTGVHVQGVDACRAALAL